MLKILSRSGRRLHYKKSFKSFTKTQSKLSHQKQEIKYIEKNIKKKVENQQKTIDY